MFWGIVLVALGVGWLLQNFEVIPLTVHFFWPVIVISIGLSLLFGRRNPRFWDPFYKEGQSGTFWSRLSEDASKDKKKANGSK